MSHEHHPDATTGDTLYETFFSGAFGGAVIAVFFLILDTLAGEILRTPSLAGRMIFFGAEMGDVTVPDLTAIAVMTAFHLVAFLGLGFLSGRVVREVEERTGGNMIASVVAVFILLEVPALLVSGVVRPSLGAELGHGLIAVANVLASVAMVGILRRAHTTAKRGA